MCIREEAFNQPLFGCNNLSFVVVPQNNWGHNTTLSVKLEFRNGGAQTFLYSFWKLMAGVNETRNAPGFFWARDSLYSCSGGSGVCAQHHVRSVRFFRLRGSYRSDVPLHGSALPAHDCTTGVVALVLAPSSVLPCSDVLLPSAHVRSV